jgi:5'-nucleotidase
MVPQHMSVQKFQHGRLILTHNKNLNKGDFLIDDRTANGADRFEGEHIHFSKEPFMNWNDVMEYLKTKA